ncbi:50S ribosomal protein L1 [Benincasa hispida]|uniref:50S ribosomal protein L1 n=1 Tax=Benincasa hispida TaxID=102211 RepID=UPI0019011B64|nr:50S ribosomal protein L1 [Benincasa hispida]XP_038877978.1 50S ribosomal protein L1 [Benincasa hispida]
MAVFKLILTQSRRHRLAKPPSLSTPQFLQFRRPLSSSQSESNPDPDSPHNQSSPRTPRSVPIQPVSYAVKPKPQSDENQDSPESLQSPPATPRPPPSPAGRRTWTREDIRYMKDNPSIASVSYPLRVAPLPEDRVSASGGGEEGVESGQMEEERKRIEAENQWRRSFRVLEEEKVTAPFPMLIKVEKKEQKVVLELMDAIRQVKANAKGNFDETVEAHARLGVDARKMQVLGNMTLPHSIGKTVRVAFFAEGADAEEARAAGADIVGGVELIEEIATSRKFNVDKCFSTPEMMRRIGKISKILRQRGLLPDPKLGTVTGDIKGALKKAREGHMHFKMDSTSIVHVGLGKVSHSEESLRENIGAFVNALLLAKPAGLKKASKYAGYVNSFHICSTMGPGFPITIQSLSKVADQYNRKYLSGVIR